MSSLENLIDPLQKLDFWLNWTKKKFVKACLCLWRVACDLCYFNEIFFVIFPTLQFVKSSSVQDKRKMKDQPEDKFNLVYLIFGWLGIGTLLPWNFFITVTAYWDAKWQDPVQLGANSSSGGNVVLERNEMQTNWNSNMAMASMIPNVTFLLLNAVFGHHFRTTPRLLVSLIFVILLFGATCAMTKIDTNEYQHEFYIGTLVSCVLININSTIFQGKI